MRLSSVLLFPFALTLSACTPAPSLDESGAQSSRQPVSSVPTVAARARVSTPVVIVSPIPTATNTPTPLLCSFADLTLSTHSEGAATAMFQGVEIKNHTAQACILQGRPTLQLVDTHGQPLPIKYVDDHWAAEDRELLGVPSATRTIMVPTVLAEQQQRLRAPVVLRPQAEALVMLALPKECSFVAPNGYRIRVYLHGEPTPQDVSSDIQSYRRDDCGPLTTVSVIVGELESR